MADDVKWMPIETAPQNKDVIVSFDGLVGEGRWKVFTYSDGSVDDDGWWWANTDSEYHDNIRPTHWMPLPEPPKDKT